MNAASVAIDLTKDVFELAFADHQGRIVERKGLSRSAFSRCLLHGPPLRVVMETCGSAHYWAHIFQAQGHPVRLLPARDMRPFLRGNKTDQADAAGLIDADRCDRIFAVAIKTPEQQGVQAQHRICETFARVRHRHSARRGEGGASGARCAGRGGKHSADRAARESQ